MKYAVDLADSIQVSTTENIDRDETMEFLEIRRIELLINSQDVNFQSLGKTTLAKIWRRKSIREFTLAGQKKRK